MKKLFLLILITIPLLFCSKSFSQSITIRKTNNSKQDTTLSFTKGESVFMYNTLKDWEVSREILETQDDVIEKYQKILVNQDSIISRLDKKKQELEVIVVKERKWKKFFRKTSISSIVVNIGVLLIFL